MRCIHCGLRLANHEPWGLPIHADGYTACPPAFGTTATKEED